MNIILLLIDTMRYDYIGANGNDWIETPNLDRLAAQSWCFDRAFAASFPTIPYRTDVMTGKYGSPFHTWKPLPFDTNALPSALGEAGYATQLIHDTPHLVNGGHAFDYPFHTWSFIRGAEVDRSWMNDEVKWPNNWCKDPLFDALEGDLTKPTIQYARTNRGRENLDDWNCAKLFNTAGQFLRDNARRENFFLWMDCFDPHEPWDVPPEFMLKYDKTPGYDGRLDPRTFQGGRSNPDLSDEAKARLKASYAAKVTWMDHCFGRFLEAFEATGLSKNTAIIVAGDHGTNVGERGKFGKGAPVHEQEIHIPLFIKTPEGDTGRSSAIVQPQDYFATIANLAGASIPDDIDNNDILAAARSGSLGNREIALAGTARGWSDQRGYFTVFDQDGYLEWRPQAEDSLLTPYGSLDNIAAENPDRVKTLHAAGIAELERRNADPILINWLKNGAQGGVPDCQLFDGYPGPEGFATYFSRIYKGT
ncbi:MAG: sulfatase [Candidatus Latescibacterota bacterium]|jgi:arylsulfatase A-like enzyme